MIANDPTVMKLLGLLGAEVSQTAAALACGVSDGYVTQLLKDPEFVRALGNVRSVKIEAAVKHDAQIDSVEAKALQAVENRLPLVRNASEAARIFQILNASKRHATAGSNTAAPGAQQVNIVLPRAASVHISMNSQNQVIEVEGKTMATLPSRSLPGLATDVAAKTATAKDVLKAATIASAAKKDTEKASQLLSNLDPLVTMIGGVQRVL